MNEISKTDSSQPSEDLPQKKSSSKWMMISLSIATLAYAGYYLWSRTGPEPPEPNLDGIDPAIVSVLEGCEGVVRRHPRSGSAWGQLGMALFVYEFKTEARTCFEHAERFDSSNPRWSYFHGVSLLPDETAAALESLRRAAELSGDNNVAPQRRLANILSELGHYDEAERNFRDIIHRFPNDPGALLGLGRLSFAKGKNEQSQQYLREAANSPFAARAATQLLVAVHNRLGQTSEALQLEQRLSQLPFDKPIPDPFVEEASKLRTGLRAWVDYGGLMIRQGNIAAARPVAQQAIKDYPDSPEAWMLMARIHLAEQELVDATKAARRAVTLSPKTVETHMQLGVVLLTGQQIDEARDCFRAAIDLKPNLSEAHHNLGLCYVRKQAWTEAIQSFQESIRLNPGFVESRLALAGALVQSGNKQAARSAVDEVLKLNPHDKRAQKILQEYSL